MFSCVYANYRRLSTDLSFIRVAHIRPLPFIVISPKSFCMYFDSHSHAHTHIDAVVQRLIDIAQKLQRNIADYTKYQNKITRE